jgi:uncharacterized protein (TIGR02996 family)
MAKTDRIPLLIGDTVEVVRGRRRVGQRGLVVDIDLNTNRLRLDFRNHKQEDESFSVADSSVEVSLGNVDFRGQPASTAVVRPEQHLPPPPQCELLAGVLAEPGAEDCRLVYSDWLEEQGLMECAEYLRVGVALRQALRAFEPHAELADHERRLRAVLDAGWVSRVRLLTTEPRPFDVARLDPDVAAEARVATRLHPRRGEVPELDGSKLGGLFLWPEEEPWPVWDNFRVDEWLRRFTQGLPVPPDGSTVDLAPLLQLNRRDFPRMPFPPGTDLMQLFWCPYQSGFTGPEPFVFWRDSKSVRRPRRTPPAPQSAWRLIPVECRLYPEEVIEYPDEYGRGGRHPYTQPLWDAVNAWVATFPAAAHDYQYWWSNCPAAKVGGWPWVNQADCERIRRQTDDGRDMEFLLSINPPDELHHTHHLWCPVEDRNLIAGWGDWKDELIGGLSGMTNTYAVLIDRASSPWLVRSYKVSSH